MSKKYLLLLLLPLVVSCGTTTSSSETTTSSEGTTSSEELINVLDLESTLSDFQKGIKVSVEMKQTYNGVESNLYLQNASKEKEFSFIQYRDEARQN